jgi:UV DNA damage endonuclease
MKLKLGLVCISEVLRDTSKVSAKTMTRKGFNSLPRAEAIALCSARTLHNSVVVYKTIQSCIAQGISHYRISSSIFPLVTDPTLHLSYDDLPDIANIRVNLIRAGDLARSCGVSLSSHPDQFNVLSSYSESVVKNTILELNHQSNVLDMMGCPANYSSPMCLHLNKTPDFKKETLAQYRERFISNFLQCNAGVRSRLVLENEDKAFWNAANLYETFGSFMPLVYDNLHDKCNTSNVDPLVLANLFRKTWCKATPVFHWSEGTDAKPRSHATRASYLPDVVAANSDCIWEVELKDKDYAIAEILTNLL